jgi:flagellar motility protein MotE (MotC chaperone)
VNLDYATIDALRRNHPAWRLLLADSAPLVASFLHRVFMLPNVRVMAQADLVERLEDELFALRQTLGETAFPRPAAEYLDDWAGPNKGWLRKFYPPGSDEPHFDLTPATERAVAWLAALAQRAFVGTESRLMTVFELLRQMVEGTETDPQARIRELQRRRAEIDAEIERIRGGDLPLLDETALRDRFQQMAATARELLADFREVEQNFRQLDRSVRERIARWEGAKGALLEEILGERDAIADSDQGRSFRAFWDFLMSSQRQEELSALLDRVLALPAVAALAPDVRLRRVHYDWLTAGEHTQRTVALLSQQLRRFLDDQALLENRRIMEILRSIEANALALRDAGGRGFAVQRLDECMAIDAAAPAVELPFERPLYEPPVRPVIAAQALVAGAADLDAEALFNQIVIDKPRLAARIRHLLQSRAQVTLAEVIATHPLEHGLAELVAYLTLAAEQAKAVFDESANERVPWQAQDGAWKVAELPRVIFVR